MEPAPTPAPNTAPEARPTGLLLSRDLIFTSKITGTARALGACVLVAGDPGLASAMIDQWRPVVVFADLTSGALVAPPVLMDLRRQAHPSTVFVAFGPHVDTLALATARAAGCDEVMPRSTFSHQLPALIRRYLGDGTEHCQPAAGASP
jgi:hypothetical protein